MDRDAWVQCLISETVTLVIRAWIRETAPDVENKEQV